MPLRRVDERLHHLVDEPLAGPDVAERVLVGLTVPEELRIDEADVRERAGSRVFEVIRNRARDRIQATAVQKGERQVAVVVAGRDVGGGELVPDRRPVEPVRIPVVRGGERVVLDPAGLRPMHVVAVRIRRAEQGRVETPPPSRALSIARPDHSTQQENADPPPLRYRSATNRRQPTPRQLQADAPRRKPDHTVGAAVLIDVLAGN